MVDRTSWSVALQPLRAARTLALALALPFAFSAPAQAAVVISQVYGGGGNSGATLKNDFIELFNNGNAAVSLSGWSVQYNSAAGTSNWQLTALPSVTIQPGQYLLVYEAAGTGGSSPLTPDATGTIAMSGTAGRVALVSNTTALSGSTNSGGAILDAISFGPATTPTEGTPTALLSNTTGALRNSGGCVDTDNNSADFTIGTPAPRNTATTPAPCDGTGGGGGGGGGGGTPPVAAAIYTIQGSGAASPLVGQTVITSGVVTKV
ncbi:MAG: lamin tail domain-containing protein, partial [Burkholderiales bacterium]